MDLPVVDAEEDAMRDLARSTDLAEDRPISDSARYRMLGNAITVPVAHWIAARMIRVLGGRGGCAD